MFGSHLSVAGGLHLAPPAAVALGMTCVQVFTKNQRQWRVPALTDDAIAQWRAAYADAKLQAAVSHDSYLINLASPRDDVREKSLALFHEELVRCAQLDIPWLVTHPGAHLGSGEEAGLRLVAQAFDQLHAQLPGLSVVTCLEITAGQGTSLGYRLEHLRDIRQMTAQPERLGYCLDTAHLLAAGYDLTSAAGARAVIDEIGQTLGWENVHVLHCNDSKVPRGKRVDRHEHIGQGHLAPEAFTTLLRHPRVAAIPKILETAKGHNDAGEDWDAVNLAALQRLADTGVKRSTRRSRK